MTDYGYRAFNDAQPETLEEAHIYLQNALCHLRNRGRSNNEYGYYDALIEIGETATKIAIDNADLRLAYLKAQAVGA